MKLIKYSQNPILKPSQNWWENRATFNAGAILDDSKIKIIYRALGEDGISRFGYAESRDGFKISKRLSLPLYESPINCSYERIGCEDPRITKIDDTFYITYCAASLYPFNAPKPKGMIRAPFRTRVALLSTKDFVTFKRFGVILPDFDDKDGVLFPEKIDNHYVLLHRIFPDIWISYSDDLKKWSGHKKIMTTQKGWEEAKIGAGAPPIKTEKGWLEFYHAVDMNNIYRLGLVVFDLEDPERIIYRSKEPILEPDQPYEREGLYKAAPKVVFCCGVVEKDNKYYIYYGASDKYVCVATIEKEKIMELLK